MDSIEVVDIRDFDDAPSLVEAIGCLLDCVKREDVVYIKDMELGSSYLLEKTLDDGSKVYDIKLTRRVK